MARSYAYRTLDALERLAQFLAMHEEALTVDHALGLAIAEGECDREPAEVQPAISYSIAQWLAGCSS